MKTNTAGIELIKHFESLHDGDSTLIGLQPKLDPVGIWTEGYGRAMHDSKGKFLRYYKNKSIAYATATIHNEYDAEIALSEDLQKFEKIVKSKVKRLINCNQFSALVSHTYNTGGSATLFKLVNNNASDYAIRDWFENHYITSGGVYLRGLKRRRIAEADLYFKKCCK